MTDSPPMAKRESAVPAPDANSRGGLGSSVQRLSGRNKDSSVRVASRSPPPLLKLSVGEIRFDASPGKQGLRSSVSSPGTLNGMSGMLPPVPVEHAKTTEQLLEQRIKRKQELGKSQSTPMTTEEEEYAYERFKRSLNSSHSHHHHPHHVMLPSVATPERRPQPPPDNLPQWSGGLSSGRQVLQAMPFHSPPTQPYASPKSGRLTVELTTMRKASPTGGYHRVHSINRSTPSAHEQRSGMVVHRSFQTSLTPNPTAGSLSSSRDLVDFGSPTTPPPRPAQLMMGSVGMVPRITFNFRVHDSETAPLELIQQKVDATAAAPLNGYGSQSPVDSTSPVLSYRGDQASNPNYYSGYSLRDSSVRSDTLPYWALPPLPIGMSDTPRVGAAPTPHSMATESVLDTARADERTLAWRHARSGPNFRGRVVLNTSAARSKVDIAAAHAPWNERFQTLLELPCVTPHDAKARSHAIACLQEEFQVAVLPIVETIIIERDSTVKTIPTEPLGGVAGGEKYVCGNIVIKFASTKKMMELYGSLDHAMKSVSNEWKGLNGLSRNDLPLLHYPLGMMVCFLGHCVWAAAKIPISGSTLRSGSRDGGKTVIEAHDAGAAAILTAIGDTMNLKRHRVGKQHAEVCGPVDLEIHCGLDGRYYALDTARMYPPDPNATFPQAHNFHLYRLLRPELVSSWHEPLSSDAYSRFGRDKKYEHDDEVRLAALSILNTAIPELIADVDKLFRLVSVRDTINFSVILHSRGINMRYLGWILDQYLRRCGSTGQRPHQPFVTHITVEIVARCFASMTRGDLLTVAVASDSMDLTPFHAVIVARFNDLFSGRCADMWRRISSVMLEKFGTPIELQRGVESLMQRKTFSLANVSEDWFHTALMHRSSQLLGVGWSLDVERDAAWFARLGMESTGDLFSIPLLSKVEPVVRLCHVSSQQVSHMLMVEGKHAEAEHRFLSELRVRASVLGETPPIVPLLHSMAELYSLPSWGAGRLRLGDAISCTERSVRIFQHMFDTHAASTQAMGYGALSDDGLAPTSSMGRSPAEAVMVVTPPPLPPLPKVFWEGYVASLANHGRLLREAGRLQEALDVVATALQLLSIHGVENKTLAASLHSSQALTWRRFGRYVDCYESAQAARAVAEGMHLNQKSKFSAARYAEALCLMAEAATLLGRRREANKHTKDALLLVNLDCRSILAELSSHEIGDDQDDTSSIGQNRRYLKSSDAAIVFITWLEVRLDVSGFQAPEIKELSLQSLRVLISEARHAFVHDFGPKSYEGLRTMIADARILKFQGRFVHATRQLEEALCYAEYLYGAQSFHEAEILILLAENSFLPLVEEKMEDLESDQIPASMVVSPANTTRGGTFGTSESVTLPPRLAIAHSYVHQSIRILQQLKIALHPLLAYGLAMSADIVRIFPRSAPAQLSHALVEVSDAVALLQSLQLHNSVPFVYALNVQSFLRIDANSNAVVIPDLFRALASSDRFMLVADSDYYTQETILYCQKKNRTAPGAKYKIILSRDGLLRKVQGQLMLVSMLLAHDELLSAALIAKGIATLVRELFPPSGLWTEECDPILPLLEYIADELLRRTGNVLGPVTEIGLRLKRIADEERMKQEAFSAQEALRTRTQEENLAAEAFRMKQERLTSQAKQVGTYFGTRAFQNGYALLHALLDAFREVYPDGASPSNPHSIAVHNSIVQHILFARGCIEGRGAHNTGTGKMSSAMEGLLQVEDHAVDALCEAVVIDPVTFEGWNHHEGSSSHSGTRRSRVEESMSLYRIGFADELPGGGGQEHSSDRDSPSPPPPGGVMLVAAANNNN